MSARGTAAVPGPSAGAAAQGVAGVGNPGGRDRRLRRWVTVPWKLAAGAWLTQSVLGAVLVLGWLQGWTRRCVCRRWWALAGRGRPEPGAEPALDASWPGFGGAPNWVVGHGAGAGTRGGGMGRWLGSLGLNLGLGVGALANLSALLLPGAVLMQLGWWGGWQNSFHKGYEQFAVGPLVSGAGILLFMAALLYAPMALTHQAVTGRARDFWRWGVVWTVVRHGWMGCTALALLLVVLNAGAMGLKTWPYFVPQAREAAAAKAWTAEGGPGASGGEPDWNALTEDQAREYLDRHHLLGGFYLFAALVVLRSVAGRVYAGALVRAVRRGALAEDDVADEPWRALHTLGLLRAPARAPRGWVVRGLAWAATRTGRGVCGVSTFLLGFVFVAQAYVSEFLNYHPFVGFLNHPMVQLPWFRYMPAHLENPAGGVGIAVVVVVFFGVWGSLRARWTRRRMPSRGRVSAEPGGPGPAGGGG